MYDNLKVDIDFDEMYSVNNKEISPPREYTDIAVQGDNNSNTLYFKLNRIIDGVDISNKEFRIFYENAEGYSDIVEIKQIAENDYIILAWLIDSNVTLSVGTVKYIIKIYDDKGYIWKSKPGSFEVAESLEGTVNLPEYAPHWAENIENEINMLSEKFIRLSQKAESLSQKDNEIINDLEMLSEKDSEINGKIEELSERVAELENRKIASSSFGAFGNVNYTGGIMPIVFGAVSEVM